MFITNKHNVKGCIKIVICHKMKKQAKVYMHVYKKETQTTLEITEEVIRESRKR